MIDAFRDVQAARADKERLQNEAYAYANQVVPEARGEAERILQGAEGYKQQTVAEATGQTARFLKVYDEYKKAPDVTRKRMFLETMERVLGGTDKIILDSKGGQGVVPYLPLDQLQHKKTRREQLIMRAFLAFLVVLVGLAAAGALSSRVHRAPERAGARAALRQAEARHQRAGPQLEAPVRRDGRVSSTSASSTSTRRRRR